MEQNKTELWTPWEWEEMTYSPPGEEPQGTTIMQVGGHYVCHQFNIRPIEQRQEIAACICLAINETYGRGINPEAVPDLLAALEKVMEYFGDQLYIDSPTPQLVAAAIEKAKL